MSSLTGRQSAARLWREYEEPFHDSVPLQRADFRRTCHAISPSNRCHPSGCGARGGAPIAQAPAPAKAPVHAKQVKRLLIKNAMVLSGPGGPGGRSDGHPARGRPDRPDRQQPQLARGGRDHRRDRQVRHAGHREHAHALARRARRADSDPVRAEPVPGRRRDDGARSRRRVREDETVARPRAPRTRSSRRASCSTRCSRTSKSRARVRP